ncbi:MAG: hypothetical protein ACOCQG_01700 [Candidatus Nanoarchaeia archaeon]
MKKAQIEIVGLLIIVLLISFVLLFVFSQTLSSEPEGYEQEFHEGIARTWVFAMLDSDTTCAPDQNMQDLIIDCALWEGDENRLFKCDDGTGDTSCDYLEENIETFVNSTIYEWGENPYKFIITEPYVSFPSEPDVLIEKTADDDSFSREGGCEVFTQPMSVGRGQGSLRIVIGVGGGCDEYDIV